MRIHICEPCLLPSFVSVKQEKTQLDIQDIVEAVCKFYRFSINEVMLHKRQTEVVAARQMIFYLLVLNTRYSLKEIGRCIAGRDHTTVIYGIETFRKKLMRKPAIAEDMQRILKLATYPGTI